SGYMSPEYAMEGCYSTKSDVYSYGVLLLEIIAGQRNTYRETGRASPNLIGHVWTLWIEGKALDIVDPALNQSYPTAMVLRCIQIGLLCVQENAMNRPSMLEVVFMLCNETPLCQPQKPAFLFNRNRDLQESSTSGAAVQRYGAKDQRVVAVIFLLVRGVIKATTKGILMIPS
ncbi:serine/threonine protein kinase, partial [Trifolium pratense]